MKLLSMKKLKKEVDDGDEGVQNVDPEPAALPEKSFIPAPGHRMSDHARHSPPWL